MNVLTRRSIFWETVELCLTGFFSCSQGEAQDRVRQKQTDWLEVAGGSRKASLLYHQEPLNVAEDIVGERLSSEKVDQVKYERLMASAKANVLSRGIKATRKNVSAAYLQQYEVQRG